MAQRDEYYFSLDVQNPADIEAINALCSVDATNGSTVICYANPSQYNNLIAAGYQPFLMTPPSLREEARMYDPQRGMYDWDSYLTYSQYVTMMEGFPATAVNGRTCTFLDLGTLSTSNHRRILGVRINNGQPNGKPKFLYTSTMHGDEVTGMILMLRLIDELCTSTDTRIVNLVNSLDIFIFPCTNPDGTYYGGNNSVSGARRANGNNVDLNRHFPDFDDGPHPDGASYYQDEAQWMMDLAQQYLFTMGANYHGGAEVVNYPWDTYQPVHPDDAWWQLVSREYANLAHAVNSNYMTDENNGITNGYAWYTITGSRQDYMNYYGQCREVTLECSSVKTPNASQLPNFWNYNHNSMLTYMEQSLKGVHGVVMDANTNQPIEGVTVTVQNHDHHGSSVTSHAVGDFHRPIKAGNWTFKFTKEGYCSETLDVTIADGARVDLTVYLSPSGSCPSDCYAEILPSTAGDYIMGYHSGNTLVMPTNSGGSTSTTTVTMMPNGDLFSIEQGEIDNPFTLTSTGTSGQYYISYNGYYLTRSTSGYGSGNRAITWSTSQGSNNRWNISSSGITQTTSGWGGTTTYYLFYNNGAFYTGTSSTNNITFYQQTDCPATDYTISVTANPAEGGTATGGGTYQEGTSCTVNATANTSYDFLNWTENGNVVSTNANYTFTVTGDRTLVANFEAQPQNYTVSVTANPNEGGSVTGGGTYQEGTSCTVTATANTGYTFSNWTENGDVVSTNASYTFTVTGDRTLVANFTLNSYNVSVTANPSQGGTVTGGGAYQHGASCTVSATANNGYTFANWTENGNVVSTNASYTFNVTSDRTLVANFTQQNYTITLSANPSNGGTATGGGAFHYGDNCTITATAANGYSFSNWTENGNVVSSNANYTFTVTGNRTLVANFTLNTYNVTVAADPANGGTVTGGGTYAYGQTCTVVATVANGFTFINWTENGSFVSSNLSYTFTVTANHNLVAHFTENPLPTYTITVTAKPEEGGTVVGGGTYQEGQSCTVRATPAPGYTFDKWMENGATLSTELSYTFTVNSNRNLVAQFEEITYTIAATVNPAEGGVVVGSGTYSYGEQATLNVEMNDNYIFQSWTEDGVVVSQEQEYTFTVTGNRTLVANLLYTEGVGEQVHVNVSLYPNPVGDKLTVEASKAIECLEVFSITGAKVLGMTSHNETLEINTANLPAGIYVVRLTTQSATEIRRFVKK
ncbi:MAG: T9SS type A sorting domain-containing protein [Bacteroidales bacterium]|nr:T9SS type A sorting domain-containing protein [Bacteroidales bacterium]